MTTHFIWNVHPELFSIGPFSVRWYGLLFAIAFIIGYRIMAWIYKTEKKPTEHLDTLLLYMFCGTLLGARLGHCFFYEPAYFFSHPVDILKVWQGGLASHGAAIGILFSLFIYSRNKRDEPFIWLLSRMCITVALAGFCIRLGNFFNSEILGRPTNLPWAVVFRRIDFYPRHPSQLYEAFSYLAIFAGLISYYYHNGANTNPRKLLGSFFALVFSARLLLEFTKEPQELFEKALPLNMGQLLSIPLILLGLYLIFTQPKKSPTN